MYLFQNNFTGGEVTPRIYARSNLDAYKNSVAEVENFFVWQYGGLERRPGTRFIESVKDHTKKVRLIPFNFNSQQAYVLEFGNQYMRVYKDYGVVLDGSNNIYEIATPYQESDLPNLKFTQSKDKLWIVDGKHPVKVLTRSGHANWTITDHASLGPFDDTNSTSTTLTASAVSGSVTLTASASVFTSAMVGRVVGIRGPVAAWAATTAYAEGAQVQTTVDSKDRIYRCKSGGTSGSTAPSGTTDYISDGTCVWEYVDDSKSAWGYGTITAYTSGTQVTVTTSTHFPTTSAVKEWRMGSFYGTVQPRAVAFYGERLWFGGTSEKPEYVWGSRSNKWTNFTVSRPVLDTDCIQGQLSSGQTNFVYWFEQYRDGLIVGTSDSIWRMSSSDASKDITPGTLRAERLTTTSSTNIQGKQIGAAVLFVGGSKQNVHELAYVFESDSFQTPLMTLLAEHLSRESKIVDFYFQTDPYKTVWFLREDGQLSGFTYMRDQKVTGWHRHVVGGDGVVESICTVPSSDYTQYDLYMVVRRTINGETKRYVEFLERPRIDDPSTEWFFVDCGLTYNGTAATTISGLDHLEGKEVDILADGAVHPRRTVTGGKITLQKPSSKVHVGLPYTSKMKTLRIDLNGVGGTAQAKQKVIHSVTIDRLNSHGGKVGSSLSKLDDVFEQPLYAMAQPVTGHKQVLYPGGWDKDGQIYIVQDQPLPLNILALILNVNIGER